MENNLTMCDYINHVTFMHIEEKVNYYILLMKSLVNYTGDHKPTFHSLAGEIVDTYKYEVRFLK